MTVRFAARGSRARPRGRGRIGTFVRTAGRFARGLAATRTLTRRKSRGEAPLTYDNDFKTDYRHRRMPRRRRRRWVKFVRKVNAVTLRNQQGLRKVIYHQVLTYAPAIDSCAFGGSLLYTSDGDPVTGHADISNIFRNHLTAAVFNSENDLTVTGPAQKVLHFESAQLEVTMRNVGSDTAIVEVYRVVCRRQHTQTQASAFNNIGGVYSLGFLKQGQIFDIESGQVVGTSVESAVEIGTTPFQSKRFCETFKIYSRKKFQIAAGNTVSFILKDARNRVLNAENSRGNLFFPRHTHGYFYQVYGAPGLVVTTPHQAVNANVLISETRKYAYRTPIYSEDRSANLS